ncbi:oxidoreductase [Romboutsia ilealis]|uniref:Phage antirepressor KilAC domain-containing protein n=1 Tax=Romboutsia faecis TaxID=2764597 RepID=A0ABR7JSQ9_9FIRM|nr:phage antirepressor KilAC domain-containing protein [Romboutsia faecis]MBC5997945.1 phage antirepressor KilAC domain-containing protein [Romboutsia faecis]MRN25640.1 oxidoreductase [Romboutsia ilealis]
MSNLVVATNENIIPIKIEVNESQEPILSGRELHEFLEIKTPYKKWFDRMKEYGFEENIDFCTVGQKSPIANGGYQEVINHAIKLDMAKEIAMIQRSEKGKQARKYFLQIEKDWNSPEKVMARALILANKKIDNLNLVNEKLQIENKELKPKAIFADSVSASHTSILVGELAKILKQNGIDTGQKRFFEWLRNNGYLIKRKGADCNMPTQKSMEQGLFEIKETTINHSDGHISISKTPKVTGKGQVYFINKLKPMLAISEA